MREFFTSAQKIHSTTGQFNLSFRHQVRHKDKCQDNSCHDTGHSKNRQLTLAGTVNTETGQDASPNEPGLKQYFSGNQTFLLRELNDRRTRLIFRMRIDWNPSSTGTIVNLGIVEPLSFVMARKTLINVGKRAEAVAAGSVKMAFDH